MKKILNYVLFQRKILLYMKLTLLINLLFVMQISASVLVHGQKLSIQTQNEPLRDVLREIERKSSYRFFYNDAFSGLNKPIQLSIKNKTIEETMVLLLSSTDMSFKVMENNLVVIAPRKELQQRAITGKVTDNTGQPLVGVSIFVKGTTVGTVSDVNGNYTITVPADAEILVFSFVGMISQEISIDDQTNINISMQVDAIGLEEVVAIGYGWMKKKDLTGAVSTVSGENLAKAPVPNLSAALAGKVTGVIVTQERGNPGFDDATFRIRGISTTGNNSPLIVVDGVVRSFSRIDPYEVESITVLKDAASTAIYGARAANGVLLITTKRGITQKARFNYSATYGSQNQTRKPTLMNAAEYARYNTEAKINSGLPPIFTEAEIAQYESGALPGYDWAETFMGNTAPYMKHNLSATGGSENMKYFFLFGYLNQKGFYSTANYNQYNIRSNIDANLSERLELGVNLAGRIENRMASSSLDQDIYHGGLMGSLPYRNPFVYFEDGSKGLANNGFGTNPIGTAERSGYDERTANVLQSNFNLRYKVPGIEGLYAKAFFSYDFTFNTRKLFKHPFEFYNLNEITGEYTKSTAGPSTIRLEQSSGTYRQSTFQAGLNYSKQINAHSFAAMALFEQTENNKGSLSALRDNFISTAIPELFAGGTTILSNDGSSFETARRGYIGRFDYDYQGKYLFQANMRIDQSFNFPKDGRNGFFPAFSAGWRISEESFMDGMNALSNMKIRASWGMVGNDRVSPFQYLSNFEFERGTVIGSNYYSGIRDTGIPNPNITWEKATIKDIGIEVGLLDNKLSFEFDYYHKTTEDILLTASGVVPYTFGASLPDENIGIVDSWGTEGIIRYSNSFGGFSILAEGNFTWFNNKAVFVAEPEDILPAIARTGRPLGLSTGWLSDGLFQTEAEILSAPIQFTEAIHNSLKPGDIRYKDLNDDGVINSDDRTIIGKSYDPNWVFGFNLNMAYKGFDLFASFQGATSYSRWNRWEPFHLDYNTWAEAIDSWRPGNEDARYPRLTAATYPANNTMSSDFWMTNISYLRLRNLEFGYNFNSQNALLSKAGLSNLRIYFSGTNLLTFSNMEWRDPEGPGGWWMFYPQVLNVALGVNVTF